MSNKFTPGPWHVAQGSVFAGVGTEVEPCIAHMDREISNGTSPTERDANATLIAASPELLAACEAALAKFRLDGDDAEHLATSALRNQLRIAITKAKGDSK